MIIFLLILLFIAAFKLKFAGNGFYSDGYISREQTLCLNGIFIAYILLSHTFAIKSGSGILSDSFNYIRIYLGQFPVAPFFFFSGFGILESIKHKKDYIKKFPKQRLLSFYVKFFILSLLYVVLNLFLRQYSLSTVLLSFTGFKDIGCGGWYIGVSMDGKLKKFACANKRNLLDTHPTSNVVFEGYELPAFDKVKELVLRASYMVPHFRMVAWDVSVLEDGTPVLIEANLYDGQLDSHQIHNGPLFGQDTEKIMNEVFNK